MTYTVFKLLFFIFFISFHTNSYEYKNIDSQLKEADEIRSSNPKKLKKILNILKKNKTLSKDQLHFLNYLIAYQNSFTGDFITPLKEYKKIINSNASLLLRFRANISTVNIYAISQNWTDGLTQLANLLEMSEKITNIKFKEQGLIVTSILYNLLGQYELAYRYSSIVQEKTNNPRTFCAASQLAIEAKFKLQQINVDDIKINQAIDACLQANEIIFTSAIRTYLARLYINNRNIQQAKELLLATVGAIEVTNYAPVIAKYYSLLAEIYFEENDYNKSIEYVHKTLEKTDDSGNSKPLIAAYSLLYKIHLQNESHQEALDYYVKYSEANNAHLEGEKAKHLAFQLAEHKSLEQKNRIKLLNEKNALLTSEQALAKVKVANVQLIIAILTVTLALLVLWGGRFLKKHKRIKELAEYDALTGIYNRGHFTQVAKSALQFCQNTQQELSIIVFDLDHFKTVNDNYGHACGDWALKETIKVCQNIGRQNDIFARLGGEEFCLLLPSCDIRVAALRAEACRVAIEDIITEASGFDFSITASFGVSDVKTSGFVLDKLLADADSAAYASKHAGRNCVTVFTVEDAEPKAQLDNVWDITD